MLAKKLFLSSVVLLFLISYPSVGASSEMWSQTYGGIEVEEAYSLVETSDGGYALTGDGGLFVKTNEHGDVDWTRAYEGYSLVGTSDGGYALAGTKNDDFWLVKIDAYGNVDWSKTYGGSEPDRAYALIETSDGGYALAGYTDSFGVGRHDCWLVKTDMHGNLEWNRTYSEGVARELVEISDGGYVFAGNNRLIKTDAYGNIVWSRTYDAETINSVIQTSDGGYALAGTKHNNFWLAKTDEYGVIPEFPSWTPMLVMVVALVAMIVVYRYNLKKLRGWATA